MKQDRIQIKHDTAANWQKAVNFTPLPGELIIYDGVLENGKYIEYPRFKIGDGATKINDLPFLAIESGTNQSTEYEYENEVLKLR